MKNNPECNAEVNQAEKNTILFTLVYDEEEYQVQTREKEYFSLMTLISDYLNIQGFGLCSGMGSCGTCMVAIDKNSALSCEIAVHDNLANTRIEIDTANF